MAHMDGMDWLDREIRVLCTRRNRAWQVVLECCAMPMISTKILRASIHEWDRLATQVDVLQEYAGALRTNRALALHPMWMPIVMPNEAHKGSRRIEEEVAA